MSAQSKAFDEWLDGIAAGEKPTVASFARSALGEIPPANAPVRFPSNRSVWPADVWKQMQAIRKGETP